MKMIFDLHNRYPSVELCYNNKSVIIRHWGGLKFDKVVLNGERSKKNEGVKTRDVMGSATFIEHFEKAIQSIKNNIK
jgi:hypothetical protein